MKFPRPGIGLEQLRFPRGIFVDAAGGLYVADSGNHRVVLGATQVGFFDDKGMSLFLTKGLELSRRSPPGGAAPTLAVAPPAPSCAWPRAKRWKQACRRMSSQFSSVLQGTANLRTKILDFRGFDSGRILIIRRGIFVSIGDFPESLSQAILVGIMLVGRLGVMIMSIIVSISDM